MIYIQADNEGRVYSWGDQEPSTAGTASTAGIAVETVPDGFKDNIRAWKLVEGQLVLDAALEKQAKAESDDFARQDALERVAGFAEDVREQVSGGASYRKMAGWTRKLIAARKVIADTADDTDSSLLAQEAARRSRSETPTQLAAKIIEKDKLYCAAIAGIDGLEAKAISAVNAADITDIPSLMTTLKLEADEAFTQFTE